MKNKLGIMLGRLSPSIDNSIQAFPVNSWKNEFEKAEKIGFEKIEWIFDERPNPLMDDDGINEIKEIKKKFNIEINSVCSDYFMGKKLFSESSFNLQKNIEILKKLIHNCYKLEIPIIEIPLVDASSIQEEKNEVEFSQNIEQILSIASEYNSLITLETDLDPSRFSKFISSLNHPNLKINYDIGNSISNGFKPELELNQLGSWIVNVHVKDRLLHGNTVSLGTGDVNFEQFFSLLSQINYSHDIIIQGAREDLYKNSVSPEETCSKYFKFVRQYLDKHQ
mgnify:CR=1 FL=1|tara:strand:- start:2821 stop:3660 length:840 start_codon:yes stop_codon:yes gene_type:complete